MIGKMAIAALALAITATITAPNPANAQQGASGSTGAFSRARDDVRLFCQGSQSCYDSQLAELRHFVGMMAMFADPDQATATRCMAAGKVTRAGRDLVDWAVAATCLRRAAQGVPMGGTLPG